MIESVQVEKRDAVGSWAVRKLRSQGLVPAVLYGHGEENVCLAIKKETVSGLLRHGTHVVNLTGAVSETALLRDVQWDTFGTAVIHLDLARVSQSEKVEVTLPIHLHGEPEGMSSEEQLRHITHEIVIECAASAIPESITVEVGKLKRDQAIHISDLELPDGVTAITPADTVVVQIVLDTGVDEDEEAADEMTEPELVGETDEVSDEAE